jgi:hypothetical protein
VEWLLQCCSFFCSDDIEESGQRWENCHLLYPSTQQRSLWALWQFDTSIRWTLHVLWGGHRCLSGKTSYIQYQHCEEVLNPQMHNEGFVLILEVHNMHNWGLFLSWGLNCKGGDDRHHKCTCMYIDASWWSRLVPEILENSICDEVDWLLMNCFVLCSILQQPGFHAQNSRTHQTTTCELWIQTLINSGLLSNQALIQHVQ